MTDRSDRFLFWEGHMAIEDFEWQGEVELTRPSQARLTEIAASTEVDAAQGGWFARLRKSVWLEPALRLFGMALLLAVLAGIGVVATTYAKPGLKLPEGSRSLAAALGTSWLKPSPVAEAASPPSSPPSHAAEAPPAASAAAPAEPAPSGGPPGVMPDGRVILNAASVDELTKLPGVGMKRAQAIVALRTKLKRFKHPTDLLRVKGIGPRGLQRMLPHLVLDG